jgi:hypothetical protein
MAVILAALAALWFGEFLASIWHSNVLEILVHAGLPGLRRVVKQACFSHGHDDVGRPYQVTCGVRLDAAT